MSDPVSLEPLDSPDRRRLFRGAALVAGGVVLAGAADLSLAGVTSSAYAARRPRVHTRQEWRARTPKAGSTILARRPDRLVVHHTASANTRSRTRAHAFALSRSIQDHHMDGNGWSDSGQHFTISRGGFVMVGRKGAMEAVQSRRHLVGAHVADHNSHTLGIENEGTYTSARPTEQLWRSLAATLAWLCQVYGLDPHRAIIGHRDLNATSCPGDRLYRMLPDLRDEVARRLGRAQVNEPAARPSAGLAGLPGPARRFDHGPALGRYEPAP